MKITHHLLGKVIQFNEAIEEIEAYPEKGMRARIESIVSRDTHLPDPKDHLYLITFDYAEFDAFNAQIESSDYYDKRGVACLTARQANMYEVQEQVYFASPDYLPFERYFTVLGERNEKLLSAFKKSGAENYVEWLESLVDV
jgi:hypothetical protein